MTKIESGLYEIDGYVVRKEYFAHGPSLFDWIVTKPGTNVYQDFAKMREAVAWIKAQS
jgi:hypothetical protein